MHDIMSKILNGTRKLPKSGWKVKGFDPFEAMTLFHHGYTLDAIGEYLHVHPATIRKAISKYPDYRQLAREHQTWHGTGSGRPLGQTDAAAREQAAAAWQFYVNGASVPQIAAYFMIKPVSVRRAFHRYYKDDYLRLKEERQNDNQENVRRDRSFSRELAWELFCDGLSVSEIARRLKVSYVSVWKVLRLIDGFQKIFDERKEHFPTEEAWDLYQQGWSTEKIGTHFGYSSGAVQKHLESHENYKKIACDNRNKGLSIGHNRKVRPENRVSVSVEEIVRLHMEGQSQENIAKELDIGRMVVRHRLAEHGLAAKHQGKRLKP